MRCLKILPLLTLPTLLLSQTTEGERATLQALLSEVQQLRIAIERSTLLGARTQIAINLMQLQENRVTRLSQELDKVRKDLLDVQGGRQGLAGRIGAAEERLPSITNPNERRDWESGIKQMKMEAEQFAGREQDRRAKEAELAGQLQSEQSQLTELRDRIAEMQRALDNAIQQLLQRH